MTLSTRRLHNNHFLSSSGTQNTFKWQRHSKADCIFVQTDLWHCVIRANILTVLFLHWHVERCDSPFNYLLPQGWGEVAWNIVKSLSSTERLCRSNNTWPRWVSKQRVLAHEMRERKEHPLNYVAGWYLSPICWGETGSRWKKLVISVNVICIQS